MATYEAYVEELKEFLRIPSISTDPERKQDVYRAAEFVAAQLRAAGMRNVELIEGEGHPLVYGEWLDAPGKSTLLFYGHYDVQPVEPLDEWITPPFEPDIRNNNIYARGAADDKGLTLVLIKAVQELMRRNGKLPVNVKFLIEGEEESGGEHIESYVSSRPARLQADAAVICDTEMFAPELPTLTTALRGIVYGEIHVESAATDMHSGAYGGAVPNAIQATAEILCALKDRDGRIRIPRFHDRVVPAPSKETEAWSRLPFNEESFARNEAKVEVLTGEPGFPALERLWVRPTFEVHGIRGGFTGEGAKTVIPARAVAKISMRLVHDQRPDEAIAQLRQALADNVPRGVKAEFQLIHAAPPCVIDVDNKFIQASAEAMEEVFGNRTVFIRCGGSIPIAGLFAEHLNLPCVLMGFGLPDDNLHAPNEKLFLPNFHRGIDAVIRYMEKLGS